MSRSYKRAVLCAFALSFAVWTPAAHAQNTEGVQVKPAIIEQNITPGDTYEFTIRVTNISSIPRTYRMSAGDISGLDDQGLPIFAQPGEATSFSLSSWVVLPQAPLSLAPGETKSVSFTVRVPTQTTPGAHFGGVFFDSGADKTSGNSSAVALKVGTIMSLTIPGQATEEARLHEFSTDKLLYSSPDVLFTSKVDNLGNVLIRPHGLIEITDMFGKKVSTVTVNDAAAPVFPGSLRAYKTEWTNEGFALGRYQATLSISYGADAKKTITATTAFWIIPIKLAATVFGGLLAIIIGIWLWVRLYLRKQLRAMGVPAAKSSDMDFYTRKYNKTGSRLLLVVVAVVLLCIVMLAGLFLFFA